MATRLRVLTRNQIAIERLEARSARKVAAAYNQARRELVSMLVEGWTGTGVLTPNEAADLLRRSSLIGNIDGRLAQLEREAGVILRDVVTSSTDIALEQVERELALLPRHLRPDMSNFAMIDNQLIERFVAQSIDEIEGAKAIMSSQLKRELQSGLIQGESFPNLVNRLMSATPTGNGPAVWRQGQVSAERMTRRMVITANNASKQASLERTNAAGGTRVQKQAVAAIGPRTTDTCLRVHGQIVDVGKPFKLTGTPRFADEMQHPMFHWNCRTGIVMYHPVFERGGLTTANMQKSAKAQLKRNRDGS